MCTGDDGTAMVYNRFRADVGDEYGPPEYPTETTGSRLAAVAGVSSTHWDVSPDDQLHLVICHGG